MRYLTEEQEKIISEQNADVQRIVNILRDRIEELNEKVIMLSDNLLSVQTKELDKHFSDFNNKDVEQTPT